MVSTVVFLVHVTTPHRHIAKLFITEVPTCISEESLKTLITEAVFCFREFNIPWANHYLEMSLKDANSEVKGAWRRANIETISYNELLIDREKVDK